MPAEIFTPSALQQLDDPEWLREARLGALAAAEALPEPSTELEEWRYSRIDELDLDRYTPAAPAAGDAAEIPVVAEVLDALGDLSGVVVLRNDFPERTWLAEGPAADGVALGALRSLDESVRARVLAAAHPPRDRFAGLNAAWSPDPVAVWVPDGVRVDRPVAVVSFLDRASDSSIVFPRLTVVVGDDAALPVVEVSLSEDVEALCVPVTEISVGADARVRHTSAQDLGSRVWQVGSFVADVGRGATLDASAAVLGGDYARLRLDCVLSGRGATGNLSSVYFGEGDQMLDLRTFQDHEARDTTSNLLFKGAVAGRSHSVYTGLIRIRPEGRGSNAFQTNRNLKLSPDAWAESVPNLEIENNEVHCSHASTVGPVDPEQRFYLESRGVPTEVADRLVVSGFFDEVLDALPVPELAGPLRERINERLDRTVAASAEATE